MVDIYRMKVDTAVLLFSWTASDLRQKQRSDT